MAVVNPSVLVEASPEQARVTILNNDGNNDPFFFHSCRLSMHVWFIITQLSSHFSSHLSDFVIRFEEPVLTVNESEGTLSVTVLYSAGDIDMEATVSFFTQDNEARGILHVL